MKKKPHKITTKHFLGPFLNLEPLESLSYKGKCSKTQFK